MRWGRAEKAKVLISLIYMMEIQKGALENIFLPNKREKQEHPSLPGIKLHEEVMQGLQDHVLIKVAAC